VVIIGGAFGKIVTSLVDDIIMRLLGVARQSQFQQFFINLGKTLMLTLDGCQGSGAPTLNYGFLFIP
jgi:large conductance mechanosensitive channel